MGNDPSIPRARAAAADDDEVKAAAAVLEKDIETSKMVRDEGAKSAMVNRRTAHVSMRTGTSTATLLAHATINLYPAPPPIAKH